jgi:YHS domain-containing protein
MIGKNHMKEKVTDPVCGKVVNPEKAKFKYKFGAKTYNFCTIGCLIFFDDNQNKFENQVAVSKGI